jgi:hypothetical protein
VRTDAAEAEAGRSRDRPREIHRSCAGGDPDPAEPGVDLDQRLQGFVRTSESGRERGDTLRAIDDGRERYTGTGGESRQPPRLGLSDYGEANEEIGEPGIDQHLGLADLGAGQPHCTGVELHRRDLWGLVRLEVWAQRHPCVVRERRHLSYVTLQERQVHHHAGRVEGRVRVW